MIGPEQYQRVAGWIALQCQRPGGLLEGCRVEMNFRGSSAHKATLGPAITKPASLSLYWRGGPTAATVSEDLAAINDPEMPVVADPPYSGGATDQIIAWTEIGGVKVLLSSVDPNPEARVPGICDEDVFKMPRPIEEHGACYSTVMWEVAPESGEVGEATVIELPTTVRRSRWWREEGHLVAHTEHPEPLTPDRARDYRTAMSNADIRLRGAEPEWTIDDADEWLDAQMKGTPHLLPPQMAAVVLQNGDVLLRWFKGLRIHAVSTDSWGPHRFVPSAVYSAILRDHDHMVPPEKLVVRGFGSSNRDGHYDLHTAEAPASRHR